MLSLTRKADYALIALVYLAHRRSVVGGPVSARQVAETFDLPLPLLMNTLKDLGHAGLVASTRGVAGGYELAASPEQVTLLDVVRAVEGAAEGEDQPAVLRRLHRRLEGLLAGATLASLLDDALDDTEADTMVPLTVGPERMKNRGT